MKIVIDTNVIVSGLLTPKGKPARILDLIYIEPKLSVFYSDGVFEEYKCVLSYDRLKIADMKKAWALDLIIIFGNRIAPSVSTIWMPDETDRVFYDTAKAAGANLITGNIKHYPKEDFIMTPADFLSMIGW
ncbi:MAG: putative toxin-antitoxin system toxin component, PIN family [Defluviitaleaceae bacterium]|nr:putative toxin-antitoxin system toxin component, PIN family [Defluviitaleaceae bacterium]